MFSPCILNTVARTPAPRCYLPHLLSATTTACTRSTTAPPTCTHAHCLPAAARTAATHTARCTHTRTPCHHLHAAPSFCHLHAPPPALLHTRATYALPTASSTILLPPRAHAACTALLRYHTYTRTRAHYRATTYHHARLPHHLLLHATRYLLPAPHLPPAHFPTTAHLRTSPRAHYWRQISPP